MSRSLVSVGFTEALNAPQSRGSTRRLYLLIVQEGEIKHSEACQELLVKHTRFNMPKRSKRVKETLQNDC